MSMLAPLLARGRAVARHAPWPRAEVDNLAWAEALYSLRDGTLSLLGLWVDAGMVHMALLEEAAVGVLSCTIADGGYLSVAAHHAPAMRLERAIADLHGIAPLGLPDTRKWLDHGTWGGAAPAPYPFLPVEGEGLHQVAVGPVHAGIIEPGHFRFTVQGEAVVRLEQRLGYTHKGIERLIEGMELDRAAMLAGRICGDSTVAYALAFARAAEAALGGSAPARAVALSAVMAELERIANHLGDFGGICNDASFALIHAHCGVLREHVLRAADAAFGHRLMRGLVVPGGVLGDLDAAGTEAIRGVLALVDARLKHLVRVYDDTASLQDRTVGTGIVAPALARQFAAGGYVGRASGRAFDSRRTLAYPPYDRLRFEVPVLEEGDVNARVWVRVREIGESAAMIRALLDTLPAGPLRASLPEGVSGEGMAIVESFRGDVLAWLRLDPDGRVARGHFRDPSWFQWPLLEAAAEGNIIADFPLCNKSFNCAYAGHDL
ncbi:MAG: hydrogenase expression protein HypE [Acetobacteraceae bacterium]|nr:hydrogenase expression protein HypE [Acetobacteraceae bacterium]